MNLCSCERLQSKHKMRKILLIKWLVHHANCLHRMYHESEAMTLSSADVTMKLIENNEEKKIKYDFSTKPQAR